MSWKQAVLADSERAARIQQARTRFGPGLVDRVARGLFESDELADAAAEVLAAMPGRTGWRMLDRALGNGVDSVPDAPQALRDLLEPLEDPPDWVNWELIETGTTAWWRFVVVNGFGLMAALVHGYQFSDLIKPMAFHGRFDEMAPRWLAETAHWLYTATGPHALRPGAEGFAETVRVRLMHAMIRYHLRRSPRWERTAWAEPINVTGTAATNLSFVLAPLAAMERSGIRLTVAEREAIAHQWRWIGTLMGVPDDLLPTSIARAEQIADILLVIYAPPDDDSRRLTRAVVYNSIAAERLLPAVVPNRIGDLVRPLARRVVSQALTTGVRRGLIDRSAADAMGVPNNLFQYSLLLLRPLIHVREAARALGLLGSDQKVAARQRARFRWALTRLDPADRAIHAEDIHVDNVA